MNNYMRHTKSIALEDIKSLLALILIVLALTLSACSQETGQNEVSVSGDTLSAPLPSALLTVDETNLVVVVVVDGGAPQTCTNLSVDQGNGTYSCNITLSGGPHSISLVFSIIDANYGTVQVATASGLDVDVIPGQTASADFSSATLTYDDVDRDDIYTLYELDEGSDPNTPSYYVGGTVSGLLGSGTIIQLNGGNDLSITIDGSFNFIPAVTETSTYTVTVLTQPSGQTCTVSNESGTVSGANISNVLVTCASVTAFYTIGGTITGLEGSGGVLQLNGANDLALDSGPGNFVIGSLPDGSNYTVTVLTQPSGQTCTVNNGDGTVSGANVTDVTITCINDDTTAPTAMCSSPSDGAANIALETTIVVTFSEEINLSNTPINSVMVSNGSPVTGTEAWEMGGTMVTFTPNSNLTKGTIYTVTISGIEDLSGNPLVSTTCTFTTIPYTWVARASMLSQRSSMGSGVINGKIYLVGGGNGGTYFSTVEAYDPTTNSWATKTPMSTTRNYLGVGVIDGILYAVGGLSGGSALASVEAYDPTTNTWTTKSPMNFARYDLAVAVVDGILYAIGGESGFDELDIVEAYNPVTDTWSTKQSLPFARDRMAVAVVDGILYAIGGEDTTNNYLASVVAYDPVSNTWSTRASMPTARRGLATGVINGHIYALGGYNGSYLDIVEVYDPVIDNWSSTTVAPMSAVRLSPAASVLGNHLYVFGGCCVAMDSTEVLILPPDGTILPIQEFTVRDIPPDGTPDGYVGGNPPPKLLYVKLTEDRAIMEFDISSVPTTVQNVSLQFTMTTLDPGGTVGSVSMHNFDGNGNPDLTDFYPTGSPVIFNGPNVSGNVTYNFDVSAAVSDARNRNVDYIGFLFLITGGVGSDRYDIQTTEGLVTNAPMLEVFQ